MSHELPEDIKRWTAQRRTALVVQIIRGEMTLTEVARKYDLKVANNDNGHDTLLSAGEDGLKSRSKEELELSVQVRQIDVIAPLLLVPKPHRSHHAGVSCPVSGEHQLDVDVEHLALAALERLLEFEPHDAGVSARAFRRSP